MIKQKKILFVLIIALLFFGFFIFKTLYSTNAPVSEVDSVQQKREAFHKQDLEKKYPAIKKFWPYIPLFFKDGLEWDLVNERSGSDPFRIVTTAKGEEHVSVMAGFRVLYKYPNTDYFAKMHVEQSYAEQYEADKQKVIDGMTFSAGNLPVIHENKSSFEIYSAGQPNLESSVLGMALILFPKDHIITTVYFLNQEPSKRKFQTFEEYENLRDEFVEGIISNRQVAL